MTTIIGIDPGKSGAIAWREPGKQTQVVNMPATPRDLIDYLLTIPGRTHGRCFLEAVHSMPTDAPRHAFPSPSAGTWGRSRRLSSRRMSPTSS